MEAFIISIIQSYLYAGVFALLLACGLGVPMPEDVILVTGGYIAYLYPQNVNLFVLILVGMAGVLIGDSMMFMVGRRFGPRAATLPLFKRVLTPARLAKMEGYFGSYGNKIIFMGRFMAGVRSPLFMTAGISGVKYSRFILVDGLAASVSVPMFIVLAYTFGEEIDRLKVMLIKTQKALFIIIPICIVVWLLLKKFAWKREEEIPDADPLDEHSFPPPADPEGLGPHSSDPQHPLRRKTDLPGRASGVRPAAKPPGRVEEDL